MCCGKDGGGVPIAGNDAWSTAPIICVRGPPGRAFDMPGPCGLGSPNGAGANGVGTGGWDNDGDAAAKGVDVDGWEANGEGCGENGDACDENGDADGENGDAGGENGEPGGENGEPCGENGDACCCGANGDVAGGGDTNGEGVDAANGAGADGAKNGDGTGAGVPKGIVGREGCPCGTKGAGVPAAATKAWGWLPKGMVTGCGARPLAPMWGVAARAGTPGCPENGAGAVASSAPENEAAGVCAASDDEGDDFAPKGLVGNGDGWVACAGGTDGKLPPSSAAWGSWFAGGFARKSVSHLGQRMRAPSAGTVSFRTRYFAAHPGQVTIMPRQ